MPSSAYFLLPSDNNDDSYESLGIMMPSNTDIFSAFRQHCSIFYGLYWRSASTTCSNQRSSSSIWLRERRQCGRNSSRSSGKIRSPGFLRRWSDCSWFVWTEHPTSQNSSSVSRWASTDVSISTEEAEKESALSSAHYSWRHLRQGENKIRAVKKLLVNHCTCLLMESRQEQRKLSRYRYSLCLRTWGLLHKELLRPQSFTSRGWSLRSPGNAA